MFAKLKAEKTGDVRAPPESTHHYGDFTPTGFASHEASVLLADPTPFPVS
jgi:hypothetical protein